MWVPQVTVPELGLRSGADCQSVTSMQAGTVSHRLPITWHNALVHTSLQCGMNECLTDPRDWPLNLSSALLFRETYRLPGLPPWQKLAAAAQGWSGPAQSWGEELNRTGEGSGVHCPINTPPTTSSSSLWNPTQRVHPVQAAAPLGTQRCRPWLPSLASSAVVWNSPAFPIRLKEQVSKTLPTSNTQYCSAACTKTCLKCLPPFVLAESPGDLSFVI